MFCSCVEIFREIENNLELIYVDYFNDGIIVYIFVQFGGYFILERNYFFWLK